MSKTFYNDLNEEFEIRFPYKQGSIRQFHSKDVKNFVERAVKKAITEYDDMIFFKDQAIRLLPNFRDTNWVSDGEDRDKALRYFGIDE